VTSPVIPVDIQPSPLPMVFESETLSLTEYVCNVLNREIRFDPSVPEVLTLLWYFSKSHFPQNRQCFGPEIRNRLMRQRL
jgi:hypothetical protein